MYSVHYPLREVARFIFVPNAIFFVDGSHPLARLRRFFSNIIEQIEEELVFLEDFKCGSDSTTPRIYVFTVANRARARSCLI